MAQLIGKEGKGIPSYLLNKRTYHGKIPHKDLTLHKNEWGLTILSPLGHAFHTLQTKEAGQHVMTAGIQGVVNNKKHDHLFVGQLLQTAIQIFQPDRFKAEWKPKSSNRDEFERNLKARSLTTRDLHWPDALTCAEQTWTGRQLSEAGYAPTTLYPKDDAIIVYFDKI